MQLGEELYRSQRSLIQRGRLADGQAVILKSPLHAGQLADYRRECQLLGDSGPLIRLEKEPLRLIFRDQGQLSLAAWLNRRSFGVEEVIQFLRQGVRLLEALHRRGLVHRQIHPDHLLWSDRPDRLWLIDFSQSCEPGGAQAELETARWRRWAYLSPEQSGRGEVDFRSDFYGLGASAYHLLTGRPPFDSAHQPSALLHAVWARQPIAPHQLRPEVPPGLSAILACLLAKDPEQRYQSGAALLADLDALEQQPSRLLEPSLGESFRLPRRLYGRTSQRQILSQVWAEVREGGRAVLWLDGAEGTGKTALAEDLRRSVGETGGFFLTGGIRAGLSSALSQLLRQEESQLGLWRERLQARLGGNARLLATILPELGPLLQIEAGPGGSPERLQEAFLCLLRGLCSRTRPIVFFLDDFHLADTEERQLAEFLACDLESEGLLWLTAGAGLEGARPIPLAGLSLPELAEWLTDAGVSEAARLASLLHARTGGNPWRVRHALEGLLRRGSTGWEWDAERVSRLQMAPDLVEEMRLRLHQLPSVSRSLLALAACLGDRFEAKLVTQAWGGAARDLEPAVRAGLVVPLDPSFQLLQFGGLAPAWLRFSHDRVRQAAYGLLESPEASHWLLQSYLSDPRQKLEQLLRCLNLIPLEQRPEQARLAWEVGAEALRRSDFASALRFWKFGREALGLTGWQEHYSLMLQLNHGLARTALFQGEKRLLGELLQELRQHGRQLSDQLPIWTLGMRALLAEDRWQEAYELSDELLRLHGQRQPRSASGWKLARSFLRTLWALGGRGPAQLRNLPVLHDPVLRALQEVQTLAAVAQARLLPGTIPLGILRDVRSVLRDGLTAAGAQCWTGYGLMLCTLGQVQSGQQFADLALEQVDRLDPEVWPRVALLAHFLIGPWRGPLHHLIPLLWEIHRRGLEVGDRTSALTSALISLGLEFFSGRPLPELLKKMGRLQHDYELYRHSAGQPELALLRAAVQQLRLGGQEPASIPSRTDTIGQTLEACLQLLLALVFADWKRAFDLACSSPPPEPSQGPLYFLFWNYALVALWHGHLQGWKGAGKRLRQGRHVLKGWRKDWVEACRNPSISGFDRAMEGARREGHLQDAAILCEQAASYCQSQTRWRAARIYSEEALSLYEQWGASDKVARLPARRLDLEVVLRASRLLAGEIDVQALVARLLELALENAGAEWGCVLLRRDSGWGVVSSRPLPLQELQLDEDNPELPVSLLRYALRTRHPAVVDEALHSMYRDDDAIRRRRPRSLLCLPLEQSQRVAGLLYLENNLASGVFSAERVQVLMALSAQMAVSLENARRFEQLQLSQRELLAQSERRHEQELRSAALQARKEGLASFLGIASHDLKSPLAAIQMWAQQGDHQEQILLACQRAGALISTYLDVAALESGSGLRLQKQSCDLSALVEAEIDFQLESLPAEERRQAQLSWDLEPTWLEVDGERVRQVVANLVGNALKHCPAGTPIHVSLQASQARVLLEVVDQGPGVSNPSGLFQPFERRSSAGTGLGLWISRLLMEAHGGQLTLISPPGCRFLCSFPLS
ncbi:AAA family ATPase [bacterium]|nr:AAA family ATPase [bacterium]